MAIPDVDHISPRTMGLVGAFAALALANSPFAHAQPTDELHTVKPVADPGCTAHTARSVDILDLAGRPSDYRGQCISTVGVWGGATLFGVPSDAEKRLSFERRKGRVLGLYLSDDDWRRASAGPARASVVGRLGLCEDLRARDSMAKGYCNYTDGPYLAVSEIRATD